MFSRNNNSLIRPAAILIAIMFCLPLAAMTPVLGASRANSPHMCHLATKAPIIDGIISPGEWSEANSSAIIMNGFNVPANQITATWYYMNDGDELYVALEFPIATDFLVLDFDDGADHVAQNGGEDYATVTNTYSDKYWSAGSGDWLTDTGAGGTTDGAGKRSADTKVYEVRKPLNSGDVRDMSVIDGETVGFRIETYGNGDYYRYHTNSVDHDLDASGSLNNEMVYWVDLITADAPPNNVPVLTAPKLTPSAGNTTTTFTYAINYTDIDNDTIKKASVLIDGTPFTMTSSDINYTDGAVFTYSTKLGAGTHNYSFNFSDGHYFINVPTTGTSSGPAVTLSSPPVLENGTVDKSEGLISDTFTYFVTYKDVNNDKPISYKITIDGKEFNMTTNETDYSVGAIYSYSTTLGVGTHSYHFKFIDVDGSVRMPITGEKSGPNVNYPNRPPVIENGTVTPLNGSHSVPFTFSVDFWDPDGDTATFVNLLMDQKNMTMSTLDGKHYTCTTHLPMEPGGYAFIASDGTFTVRTPASGFNNGPNVLNYGPSSVFIAEPSVQTVKVGQTIKLDGSGSSDPDGDELQFLWSSSKDGELGTGKVIYANLSVGLHSIRLTVVDVYGARNVSHPYNLTVIPLEPKLTSTPPTPSIKTPQEGDTIVWNITISNIGESSSVLVSLDWLVDGTKVKNTSIPSIAPNGNQTAEMTWVALPGTHKISVVMGTWFNLSVNISVIANKAPVAKMNVPLNANVKQVITFNASTSTDPENKPMTYTWDFGDQTNGTGPVVTHAYKKAGKYTVTLVVTDQLGVKTTINQIITIKSKPATKGFIPGFELATMVIALAAATLLVSIRRRT